MGPGAIPLNNDFKERSRNPNYGKKIPWRGKPNWNGAMIEIQTITFGAGLPNCSVNEEMLTCHDIINCLVFSDRNKSEITITFNKDFLRRILKSHIHNLEENRII